MTCKHGCHRHYFVVNRNGVGVCECGCKRSKQDIDRMVDNMKAGRSRSKSVVCFPNMWISAEGWERPPAKIGFCLGAAERKAKGRTEGR